MAPLISAGSLVFDVGANVGAKAETFVAAGARVVCIEPQPRCVRELRRRFQGHSAVTIVEAAIADRAGRRKLSICSEADTISTFSTAWKTGRFANYTWDREIEVETVTLDELAARFGSPHYTKVDVEGFELDVLGGLSSALPYISIEFAYEFLDRTEACVHRLEALGFRRFHASFGESGVLMDGPWTDGTTLLARLRGLSDPLAWGDVFATTELLPATTLPSDSLDEMRRGGLVGSGPLRLHLGCGEQRLDGYINIDYPREQHQLMRVMPDFAADLQALSFPVESVDEIRSHHVFEHFNRVTALALVARWQRWLKPGGVLRIETPDLAGSATTLTSDAPLSHKLAAARHLAGDQAASWAFHVDHWFPERFVRTLSALGFRDVVCEQSRWPDPPHLANVTASATRAALRSPGEQRAAVFGLLWDSTVHPVERPTWEVWCQQARATMDAPSASRGVTDVAAAAPSSARPITVVVFSKDRPAQLDALLRSLLTQCTDGEALLIKVLFKASTPMLRRLYDVVADELPHVDLVEERDFRAQLLAMLAGTHHVLFTVDDTLFTGGFSVRAAAMRLDADHEALGFSFRLGRNATYVYALDKAQTLPPFEEPHTDLLRFCWKTATLAFAYPLEVSSSLYRTEDILPLIENATFTNPNTLESALAEIANRPNTLRTHLLCPAQSVAFSAPINIVQQVYDNRAGRRQENDPRTLADRFAAGDRIDVTAFDGFISYGPHQEVELHWRTRERCPLPPSVTSEPAADLPPKPETLLDIFGDAARRTRRWAKLRLTRHS